MTKPRIFRSGYGLSMVFTNTTLPWCDEGVTEREFKYEVELRTTNNSFY